MAPCPVRTRPVRSLFPILLALALAISGCGDDIPGKAQSVAALAGASGGPGFFNGSPSDPVRFDSPSGVAVTSTGDRFVADTENHVIRKIDASGNVTTLAGKFGVPGSSDGTGANARFSRITAITAVGTSLYLCDNNAIRSISAAGAVVTVAGVSGLTGSTDNPVDNTNVRFSSPMGIASNGSTILFVADTGNHKIRRVSTVTGATATVAGSGVSGFADNTLATAARFNSPEGVAFDEAFLFVADTGNHAIRKVAAPFSAGEVSTLAGTGVPGYVDNAGGTSARFSSPRSLISVGADLFVADTGNHAIRKVDTLNFGFTTTLAGGGVPGYVDNTSGTSVRFNGLKGIAVQAGVTSLFYAADTENHVVRQVTPGGAVNTVSGNPPRKGTADGSGAAARFSGPGGCALLGDDLYVADTENHAIQKITPGGVVSTFAGLAGISGFTDSPPRFNRPWGIVALDNNLYVADTGNHTIRKITSAGVVSTVAGLAETSGITDSTPRFNGPQGIAALGGDLYVADTGNHTVRKIASPSGLNPLVSLFAGSAGSSGFLDGQGDSARFASPDGLAAVGSVLYVADPGNHAVRRISATRSVTTFVGTPDAATTRNGDASLVLLNSPAGVAGKAGTIYFTDTNENVVRRILF